VSDGELHVELEMGKAGTRRRLIDMADRRLASVMAWQQDLAVPVLPLSTDEDVLEQTRRLLGHSPRATAR